jgi:hypothetical protein
MPRWGDLNLHHPLSGEALVMHHGAGFIALAVPVLFPGLRRLALVLHYPVVSMRRV